jgi:hypothetical protein
MLFEFYECSTFARHATLYALYFYGLFNYAVSSWYCVAWIQEN